MKTQWIYIVWYVALIALMALGAILMINKHKEWWIYLLINHTALIVTGSIIINSLKIEKNDKK